MTAATTLRPLTLLSVAFALALGCAAQTAAAAQKLDVPYVPTPHDVVNKMLRMVGAKPGDVLYDLGSGDGRIVITAVRDFGVAKGVGVDLNPVRVAEAKDNAEKAGVADKITFVEGNVFTFDFSEATVLTMYLLPRVNRELRPKILALRPGTRVVSHQFTMGDWEPDESADVRGRDVHAWIVPAKVGGTWQWGDYRLDLHQNFQEVSGTLRSGTGRTQIRQARLEGDRLRFQARLDGKELRFDGRVNGDTMTAEVGGERTEIRRAE